MVWEVWSIIRVFVSYFMLFDFVLSSVYNVYIYSYEFCGEILNVVFCELCNI